MEKKDLLEMQNVCGVYPMAHYFDELLDGLCDELPDVIDSSTLRSALKDFISQLEDYQNKARKTFLNAWKV